MTEYFWIRIQMYGEKIKNKQFYLFPYFWVMSYNVAQTTGQYHAWAGVLGNLADRHSELSELGPRPSFGQIIATDPEYDDVVSAQEAWDFFFTPIRDEINFLVGLARQVELGIADYCWPDQWVEVQAEMIGHPSAWIGYASGPIIKVIVLNYAPANNFPDQTPA